MSAEARVDFGVLGALEVLQDGRPVRVQGRKPRALLAMLALHPGVVVSAERLAEGLWGEQPPVSTAATLQVYVSQLRKVLGAHMIQTRPPGYVLAVEPERVDAVRFERLVAEGRSLAESDPAAGVERLSQALSLWRGPVLADFAFEDFARSEIARLEELRLVALEERFQAELALGRHVQLVGSLRALVEEHPLREGLWAQLVLALYRGGRQAEALRACTEVRRVLGEELGIEPGPALRQLEAEVLAQDPDLDLGAFAVSDSATHPTEADRPDSRLPVQLTEFIGRSDQVVELRKRLAGARLVTLTGSAGIGKSRLALEVLRLVVADHPGTVYLVELAPLDDPRLVPEQVLASLGQLPKPVRQAIDGCIERLRPRDALLLLDNCEHLLADVASLADTLLRSCPNLRLLATSREPLGVPGEVVWRVPPLSAPARGDARRLPLEALWEYEAVQLFMDRVTSSRPDFEPSAADAPALAEICCRLDGVPLAIELAAARAGTLSLEVIARRLDDRFRLLSAGARTAPRRHQSLRAALDWSYRLLTPSESAVLDALSVFAGGFGLEAAERVCWERPEERAEAANVLAGLVDKSLVLVQARGGAVRYGLLESVRTYLLGRLAASGKETDVRERHLAWVVSLAEKAASGLEGSEQGTWLATLEAERDNIRTALEWATSAPGRAGGLRLAAALCAFWQMRGPGEGRAWISKAMAANPDAAPEVRAQALHCAAVLAQQQRDLGVARGLYEESRDLWRTLGHRLGIVAASQGLASLASTAEDIEGARASVEENLAIGRELGDDRIVAASLTNLALLHQRDYVAGRIDLRQFASPARRLHEQALVLYRRAGDRRAVGMTFENLATIAAFERDRALERSMHEQALAARQEIGDKAGVASSVRALGVLALLEDDYVGADTLTSQSLEIDREFGNSANVARTLVYQADAAFGRGENQLALTLLEESLAIHRRRGDKIAMAAVLGALGATACRARDYTRARMALEESLELARATGDPRQLAWSLARLGVLARAEGDLDRVEFLWRQTKCVVDVRCSPGAVGQFLELLAGVAAGRGDFIRAATLFGAADGITGPDVGFKPVDDGPEYRRDVSSTRRSLSDVRFEQAWKSGQAMTLEDVLSFT